MLAIGRRTMTTEQEILADLADENPQRIRTFLWGMEKLGYVRQLYGQLTIGNEYLRRWMQEQWTQLEPMTDTLLAEDSDRATVANRARANRANLRTEIERIEREYDKLQTQLLAASSNGHSAETAGELERLNRLLTTARRDYEWATARQHHQPTP